MTQRVKTPLHMYEEGPEFESLAPMWQKQTDRQTDRHPSVRRHLEMETGRSWEPAGQLI